MIHIFHLIAGTDVTALMPGGCTTGDSMHGADDLGQLGGICGWKHDVRNSSLSLLYKGLGSNLWTISLAGGNELQLNQNSSSNGAMTASRATAM